MQVGICAQKRFVHAIEQIIALAFGKTQLDAECDGKTDFVAKALSLLISKEIARDAFLPVVPAVLQGNIAFVQVIGDGKAVVTRGFVGCYEVCRGDDAAFAGLRCVYMQVELGVWFAVNHGHVYV